MLTRIRTTLRHDTGASTVEYGLVIVAIVAVIVAVTFALGRVTQSQFSDTCSAWDTAAGTSSC